MKKRNWTSYIVVLAGAVVLNSPMQVLADSTNELEKRQNELSQERSNLNQRIESKNSEMESIGMEQQNAATQLESLLKSIEETDRKLKEQQSQVDDENAKIEKLQKDIADLKEKIQNRQEVLKDRARAIQKNGNAQSYLNILLESQDFSDLIERVNVVSVLVNADQNIIKQQKDDQELLDQKETASQKKLTELKLLASKIEVSKNNLESQKAEKNDLILALAEKENKTASEKTLLEKQQGSLSAEEKQVAANIQSAKAEEARKQQEAAAKAEEARRAATVASASEKAKGGGTESTGSTSAASSAGSSQATSPAANKPSGNGGMFIKPAAGILTSGFSDRINPVTGQHESHKGQDIAAGGTVTVSAAADGTVVFAGYGAPGSGYGGYGYVVKIDHGNGYQTLYGHMRAGSLNVVAGQRVMQGQAIGIMGSTGQSTGQHLHFEIHQNGVPVDPAPYL